MFLSCVLAACVDEEIDTPRGTLIIVLCCGHSRLNEGYNSGCSGCPVNLLQLCRSSLWCSSTAGMASVVAAGTVFVALKSLGRQKVGHTAMSRRWGGGGQ